MVANQQQDERVEAVRACINAHDDFGTRVRARAALASLTTELAEAKAALERIRDEGDSQWCAAIARSALTQDPAKET